MGLSAHLSSTFSIKDRQNHLLFYSVQPDDFTHQGRASRGKWAYLTISLPQPFPSQTGQNHPFFISLSNARRFYSSRESLQGKMGLSDNLSSSTFFLQTKPPLTLLFSLVCYTRLFYSPRENLQEMKGLRVRYISLKVFRQMARWFKWRLFSVDELDAVWFCRSSKSSQYIYVNNNRI